MHLITCTCGREYNADSLIRCPACDTLTQELVKVQHRSSTPSNPVAKARPYGNSNDDMNRRILAELQVQSGLLRTVRNVALSFSSAVGLLFLISAFLIWQELN